MYLPTQEMHIWSLCWEDPLEKQMATHSSILAWRIPCTGELGGLSPRGCKESSTSEHTRSASTTALWCVALRCRAQETHTTCSTKVAWIKINLKKCWYCCLFIFTLCSIIEISKETSLLWLGGKLWNSMNF